MNSLFDLSGKVALVTGARTGLGAGMALALARAGADIVALGSSPMPETEAAVESLGRRFCALQHDLTLKQDYAAIVAEAEAALGPVDILVNNAGIIRRDDLMDHSLSDFEDVVQINMTSVFGLSQAVACRMIEDERPGRIINIASLLSFQGGIRVPGYTASKHGVLGLTRALANELASHSITVNAIAPGYMATDNTAALQQDRERNRQILERIPAGRWGNPEDLSTTVLYLSSDASSYVTGSIIPVDGGWMAR